MGGSLETINPDILTIVAVVILVVILWAFVASVFRKPLSIDDMKVWPYVPRVLMTATERELYARLRQALPEYLIFSQVQLSRIIDVAPEAEHQSWLNRINRMSVDFVVCAPDGAKILAAIELDDSSHEKADRIQADAKKDKALRSAGVPIIRWPVKGMPHVQQLRADFLKRR